MLIDKRVAEWFADFSAAEQLAIRAEVSLWSMWLLNSMQESDISPLDVADFLRATERPE